MMMSQSTYHYTFFYEHQQVIASDSEQSRHKGPTPQHEASAHPLELIGR